MTETRPHTGSYYAATVTRVTDYPSLEGEHRADVCVIGAGFTGISTALFLAERGYDVHVVEASRVGWGASGRNGGQLIGGISGEEKIARHHGAEVARLLRDLRWAGHDIIRDRIASHGIDCDLKWGYLDVAIKQRHVEAFRQERDQLQSESFPHEVRLLSAEETRATIGTDAYIGALLNMGNGHLHPLNLCVGEARAAEELGVTLFEQSPVVKIDRSPKPTVVTAKGSVTADAVVLAGNAYHDLAPELRGVMFPVRSYIIATEQLSPEQVAAINPQDLAVCDPNFVIEYFRLSADKRLLFGGRLNYFGEDAAVIAANLRRKMARIYPQLSDARIDYAWGGTIGVPLNRVPRMGMLTSGIFYCQGYSGHGVNVTHLAGRILADAVAGTMEHFDVFAKVPAIVVPFAHQLQTPLVALGVLYYQIRDRL